MVCTCGGNILVSVEQRRGFAGDVLTTVRARCDGCGRTGKAGAWFEPMTAANGVTLPARSVEQARAIAVGRVLDDSYQRARAARFEQWKQAEQAATER